MPKIITASIDVKLLDKNRFKPFRRKNGTEALFCELVLIETTGNSYGDYIVKQSVTKEEREAKVEMPIIGNAKVFNGKGGGKSGSSSRPASSPKPESDDDVPF